MLWRGESLISGDNGGEGVDLIKRMKKGKAPGIDEGAYVDANCSGSRWRQLDEETVEHMYERVFDSGGLENRASCAKMEEVESDV